MLKIIVFGGSGFLGSHVCDQLSKQTHQVTVFDWKESSWLGNQQNMIVGDLLDAKKVMDAVEGADVVYNFAALSDLNEALEKPLETVKINILGNTNILEACRLHGVKRFLYASTVYVNSREGGFYRCSKHAAEQYIEEYQKAYGLDYTILRYGSLYGPRADNRNGLYRIVEYALKTGVLRYVGSPDSLREYIHVEDAAKASVAVLDKSFCNQSVVLTGQESMKVLDLLEMLAEILELKHPVEFIPGKHSGHYTRTPYAYKPDLGRKYIPTTHVDLGQGLLQLIDIVNDTIKSS